MKKFNSKVNIICLHGALATERQFDSLFLEGSSSFNLSRFTFHGHGGSHEAFTLESLSNQLKEFIASTFKKKEYFILGYSMGGYVAMHALIQNVIDPKGIILVNTKLDWNPVVLQNELHKLNYDKMCEKIPGFIKSLDSLHAPISAIDLLDSTKQFLASLVENRNAFNEGLRNINRPILLSRSELDTFVSAEEYQSLCRISSQFSYCSYMQAKHSFESISIQDLISNISNFIS
ncbi:MAG TPA: alpha/beta hydrolase [Bacteroidia bacterium]|nr:alpha/beta hydrolase [Bacteroidia bacterium]HNT79160.1 alpha/beta hydrolase [Bacteroidia bacterium]